VGLRGYVLGLVLSAAGPAAGWAQLAPVGVAPGVVRLEADGALESWDKRWLDGRREGYGADLASPALGADLFPFLAQSESAIQRVTGQSAFRLNLGALTTDAAVDRGVGMFGASLGLTRAITIFGRMPLVSVRVQHASTLDGAAANAGANPGSAQQQPFFSQFDAAIATLTARIAAGDYAGDPATLALAQSTLAGATALRDDLFGLLSNEATASPFVPLATSTAGVALDGRVTALQNTLAASLGVGGFTETPVLPTAPLTAAELEAEVADPAAPIGILTDQSKVVFRGDAEAGLALTLVDRWDRGARRGGVRAAVEGLVRFPTGRLARTDRLLALGTGDGQTDVEARGTLDLGGGRWGVRLEGRYNRQLAAYLVDRVAPPSQPYPARDLLAAVRFDPGDETSFAVRPFYRIANALAIIASAERWHHGSDDYAYAAGAEPVPGVDAAVLGGETDVSATLVSIGLTYSSPGVARPNSRSLPVDAGWSYERVVGASGGRVPDVHRVRARFRLYLGLW
jgi:hypothetical protein